MIRCHIAIRELGSSWLLNQRRTSLRSVNFAECQIGALGRRFPYYVVQSGPVMLGQFTQIYAVMRYLLLSKFNLLDFKMIVPRHLLDCGSVSFETLRLTDQSMDPG